VPGATPRAEARASVLGRRAATTGRGREADSHDPAGVRRGTSVVPRERAVDHCDRAVPAAGPAVRHETVALHGTAVGRHGPSAVRRGMADADREVDPIARTSEADAHHPCMAADPGRGEARVARRTGGPQGAGPCVDRAVHPGSRRASTARGADQVHPVADRTVAHGPMPGKARHLNSTAVAEDRFRGRIEHKIVFARFSRRDDFEAEHLGP